MPSPSRSAAAQVGQAESPSWIEPLAQMGGSITGQGGSAQGGGLDVTPPLVVGPASGPLRRPVRSVEGADIATEIAE